MGRLLSLDQVEKGKEIRTALMQIRKIIDKDIIVDAEPKTNFELSLEPNKDDVVMKINGVDYLEDESFTINRDMRQLYWSGAFDITPKLNVEDGEINRDYHYSGGSTMLLNTENVQIHYVSDEEYDGLVDPDCKGMYKNNWTLQYAPELKTERIRDMTGMFEGCSNLVSIPEYETQKVQSMRRMFYMCSKLNRIPTLTTSKVIDMRGVFSGCSSLTTVPQLDTSKVIDMSDMFSGCRSLTTIPQIETSKVIDMRGVFSGCSSLTTVPQLDTSKVIDMSNMFSGCGSLTTVPQLDTSKIKYMYNMFSGCNKLVSIGKMNLNSIRQSGMYYYNSPFGNCSELQNITFESNTIHYGISFAGSPKLTKASLLSILNGLGTPKDSDKTLTLHADSKALLSEDEIKIATNKGWTVA